ncbi:MAG: hypothetical protein HRT88_19860 [Lentisphaeraceae bacterium]|nr:hypothetical protein [Lentisphaeraceae bacterium]
MFKKISLTLLTSVFSLSAQSPNFVDNSENQWPMSGGPQGNWKVDSKSTVPLKWSVRDNKNIKWKTQLPAGGQSGIAIWGKQLFLTINPPTDTPNYKKVTIKIKLTAAEYKQLYKAAEDKFAQEKNANFLKLKSTYEKKYARV